MRACLVSGRVTVFEDEGADRERGLDLLVVRAAERVEALDFGLDLVMGSSEVMRRHPPHHLSPAREKSWQGKTPKRAFATSSHRSNAPIKPISQSILSKIVALLTAIMACLGLARVTFPLGRSLPVTRFSVGPSGAERLAWLGHGILRGSCGAIRRTTSAPPGQITRQGRTPKRAFAASSHCSNAPIKPKSQSILSKIIAPTPLKLTSGISRKMIDLKPYRFEINQE